MKNSGMIRLVTVAIACVLSGCVSDVSNKFPHKNLIGTTWRIKNDAYVVDNPNGDWRQLLVPCEQRFRSYVPNKHWEFDESRVGEKDDTFQILAAVKKGQVVRIDRVLREKNIEMGDSYYPMGVVVENGDGFVGGEVNLYLYYAGFDTVGSLNPKYAEKVGTETNPPPRGATGSGGSESSNP